MAQVVGVLAGLATIAALILGIRQLVLASRAFRADQEDRLLQLERHKAEQLEATQQREEARRASEERHRATIFTALRIELETIQRSADQDLEEFQLHTRNRPRTQAVSNEGEPGFKRSFVWTPLPMSTLEQAIYEAYLLGLTKEQLQSLQDLRLRLIRINSHIDAKISVMSALVQNTVGQMLEQYTQMWAGVRSDNLNSIVTDELRKMSGECATIIKWLPKE